MTMQQSLTDQLELALASRDLSRRAAILHRVADLFMHGSGHFSADQIELFDEVMSRLIEAVEVAARAAFGSRLARVADAPGRAMRRLAFDDSIEVAGPVLTHCAQLDDAALVDNARTRSQEHMLAISRRSSLAECVTDVLVDRGNRVVVVSTASNPGAKFSAGGIATLVARSRAHGDLAMCVWSRPDIPRQDLVKLFAQASEAVRKQLQAANPRRAAQIVSAVDGAADELQAVARAGSHVHATARADVTSLHSAGKLDEARLAEFAHTSSFDSIAVALSLLCDVPVGLAERALVQSEPEQLMILAKAVDLSWETTKRLLCLHAVPADSERLNDCFASYLRLKPKTAQAALQFYRMRERAGREPQAPN